MSAILDREIILNAVPGSGLSKGDLPIELKALFTDSRVESTSSSVESARPLTSEEQQQLRDSLNREAERIALARAVCGKYAFVPTSSESFAANKPEEIAREDRPR